MHGLTLGPEILASRRAFASARAGTALAVLIAMVACARPPLTSPRLVHEAPAGSHARLRVWHADAGEVRPSPPAAHPGVELAWIGDGEIRYGIGKHRFDVAAGCAMLVPSGVEHATSFPTYMRGAALWVDRDTVAEIADALGCKHGPSIGLVRDPARITSLGAVLAHESKSTDAGALLATDAISEAMIAIAVGGVTARDDEPRVPIDPAIASAVRHIESAYAEPLTVEGMARVAHMSRFHFSRRFRDATGRSPYRFLVDVRLERAAELLRRGRRGVTDTALSVGFSDPSRFARMFRQRFGASPAQWAATTRSRVLHLLPAV